MKSCLGPVLASLLLAACGSSHKSNRNDAPAPAPTPAPAGLTNASLNGTWLDACGVFDNATKTYGTGTVTFKDGQAQEDDVVYSDAACTKKLGTVSLTATYAIGAASKDVAGAYDFDQTDGKMTYTGTGFSDPCGLDDTATPGSCTFNSTLYDLVSVSGSTLTFGLDDGSAHDSSTAAKRPVKLDPSHQLTRK